MRLQVHGTDHALAEAMRSYIERRLRLILGRYAARLAHVTVRVSGAAGPNDTAGCGCRIQAELVPSGCLLRHEVSDRCLFSAVDTAVERMGRSVRRQVSQEGCGHGVASMVVEGR